MLVYGLLTGVVTKFHINRRFTKEISITRGVRQGCPLSFLLFALTMQPLMEYLQHKLSTGKIEGTKIDEELTIYHRFANDVGIFITMDEQSFVKLQEAL